MAEAQTLLTVVAMVVSLRPEPRAATRAGFRPRLADKTQPKTTSSTASTETVDFFIAAKINLIYQMHV